MRHRRHVHQLVGRHVGHAVVVLQPAQYFRGLQGVHAEIVGQTVVGVHGGGFQLLQPGDLADHVRQDLFVYRLLVDLRLGVRLGDLRQPGAPEIEGVKFQFFPAELVVPVLQPGVQFHLVLAFSGKVASRHLDLDINRPSRCEENAVQQNRLEAVPQLSEKPGPAVLEDIRERTAPKARGVRQSDRRVGNFGKNVVHAGLGADDFVILAPEGAAGIDDDVVAILQGFHDLVQGSLNSSALVSGNSPLDVRHGDGVQSPEDPLDAGHVVEILDDHNSGVRGVPESQDFHHGIHLRGMVRQDEHALLALDIFQSFHLHAVAQLYEKLRRKDHQSHGGIEFPSAVLKAHVKAQQNHQGAADAEDRERLVRRYDLEDLKQEENESRDQSRQ